MLHPYIDNSIIVCKAGIKHGVDCGTSTSLSFVNLSQQIIHIHIALDAATTAKVDDIVQGIDLHCGIHVEDGR